MQNYKSKNPKHKIGVTLAGFHTIVLESMQLMLENAGDFTVVSGFISVDQLLEADAADIGGVILLNLIQDDDQAVECIKQIREAASEARIVVLTNTKDAHNQKRAVELGAAGVVQVEQNSRLLLEALKQVDRGETWINQKLLFQVLNKQLQTYASDSPQSISAANIASLSAREHEVILLIGKGLKNKEIAKQLIISEATVRHHLRSIYDKLDLPDRLNLVIYAYQHRLVNIAPDGNRE